MADYVWRPVQANDLTALDALDRACLLADGPVSVSDPAYADLLATPGRLTLRTLLDLRTVGSPSVQPGSRLDPDAIRSEKIAVTPAGTRKGRLKWERRDKWLEFERAGIILEVPTHQKDPISVEIEIETGGGGGNLSFGYSRDRRASGDRARRWFVPCH